MSEERRIKDLRVSPAVAEFALQERGELLARITELEDSYNDACDDAMGVARELAALKAGQGEAVAWRTGSIVWAYEADAISHVENSRTQVEPLYTAQPATGVIDPGWRCFHCDENFTDEESATLHFGDHEHKKPACLIDVAEYRAMEARMHAYNEEDAEIHRTMNRMRGQHRTDLQREEEKGYARALKDTGYDDTGVNVPRELLERIAGNCDPDCCIAYWRDELRALLAQSQEVKS